MSGSPSGPSVRLEEIRSQRAIVVFNERTKLLANALDRFSTAMLTGGVLGPIAAGLYGVGVNIRVERLIAWFAIWVVCALTLHGAARRILGGMA
jgi:hypothetical protein